MNRFLAWLEWHIALAGLWNVVPHRAMKLGHIVERVAEVLELPRTDVARALRARVVAGADLREAIADLAGATDPSMVTPLGHMWSVWFPGDAAA